MNIAITLILALVSLQNFAHASNGEQLVVTTDAAVVASQTLKQEMEAIDMIQDVSVRSNPGRCNAAAIEAGCYNFRDENLRRQRLRSRFCVCP